MTAAAPLVDATPLGDLLRAMRQAAYNAGAVNPEPTVLATEPLRFWSKAAALAWLRLNGIENTGAPHVIGGVTVVPAQVGVYLLVIHWPGEVLP